MLFENERKLPELDELPGLARALGYDVRCFCRLFLEELHPVFSSTVFGSDVDAGQGDMPRLPDKLDF
jgi:hypothetical protein